MSRVKFEEMTNEELAEYLADKVYVATSVLQVMQWEERITDSEEISLDIAAYAKKRLLEEWT